jgi:hypothetical protein
MGTATVLVTWQAEGAPMLHGSCAATVKGAAAGRIWLALDCAALGGSCALHAEVRFDSCGTSLEG